LTRLYHITHIRNLESIIEKGGIVCDSSMNDNHIEHIGIAHKHIKERRARKRVPIDPSGTLADYVPFYFAPRSPMLYAIHTGYVEGYEGGQGAILHLVTSVETVLAKRLPFVFTDGHAEMAISRFFHDVSNLNQVDWEIMKATYWNDTEQDNDRSRRRQAEFLVHDFFPWKLFKEIGVINDTVAEKIEDMLSSLIRKSPAVTVQRKWYY
jgi:hypothetical protein